MARLNQISPEAATGRARDLLDAVKDKLGLVPNMTRAMANAPAALDGYLQLSGALAKGTLPAKVREQIALAVAQANGCDYCLAAHSAVGRMVGLTAEQIRDSRLGTAVDPKADALIRFALKVVDARGRVERRRPGRRSAGPGSTTAAIAEVVGQRRAARLHQLLQPVAETDLDFPRAEALTRPRR